MQIMNEFDVARFLGCSVPKVLKWTRAGLIPHFELPNAELRWIRSEVETWALGRQQPAQETNA